MSKDASIRCKTFHYLLLGVNPPKQISFSIPSCLRANSETLAICCKNPKPCPTQQMSFSTPLIAFGRIPKLSPICSKNPGLLFNPPLIVFGRIPKLSPICSKNPGQLFNPPLNALGRIPKLSPICNKNPKPSKTAASRGEKRRICSF